MGRGSLEMGMGLGAEPRGRAWTDVDELLSVLHNIKILIIGGIF